MTYGSTASPVDGFRRNATLDRWGLPLRIYHSSDGHMWVRASARARGVDGSAILVDDRQKTGVDSPDRPLGVGTWAINVSRAGASRRAVATVFCLGGLASRRPVGDTRTHSPPTTRFGEVDVGAPGAAWRADDWGCVWRSLAADSEELELGEVEPDADADGGIARGPGGCAGTSSDVSPLPHLRWLSGRVCVVPSVAIQMTDGQSSAGGRSLLVGRSASQRLAHRQPPRRTLDSKWIADNQPSNIASPSRRIAIHLLLHLHVVGWSDNYRPSRRTAVRLLPSLQAA